MKKYKIYYQEDSLIKSISINTDNINTYDLPNNIIKIKESKNFNLIKINLFESVKKNEIINLFIQLDIILKANILLIDGIEILIKSVKNKILIDILVSMKNALINGLPIYKSLEKYDNHLDPAIIPFFNILENKGSLTLIVSSLTKLLLLKKENKKLIISALSYPIIVLITFIFSLILIFILVVPKFESIFLQYDMDLPYSTIVLLGVKSFFIDFYSLIVIFSFASTFISYYLYKKHKKFSYAFDKILLLKIPIISKLILTHELYNFFIALNILLKSKYEFHTAIDNSVILLRNKYLLGRITKINEHLKNGKSIEFSFMQTEIFDELTISLINTGEKSSSLPLTVNEIEKIYKNNFQQSIKNFSSLIEPIFFITISLLVLWIMLAVFTPIWNMSSMFNV